MNFDQYLHRYLHENEVTLVGPLVDSQIQFDDPVIFVDGGAHGRIGDHGLCVGDGDSWSGPMDIQLPTEKDFSDLAFALSLIPEHFQCLHLHGFLGGRRDHELFNLGEVFQFLQRRLSDTTVLFDQEVIAYSAGQWSLAIEGTFSLGALIPTEVTLSGSCKYPITEGTVVSPLSSLGLSNEGHGKILLTNNAPIFIFRNT